MSRDGIRTVDAGMGDIDILIYYITIITIIALIISILKTVYKHVKLYTNVSKHCKTCHDKCQLSQYS